jgi:hypothetical protein
LTQLCVNNIRHYAQISGWELILFDNDSVFNYLTPESGEKLRLLKRNIKNLQVQGLSDLHRMFVLHDNGGMWNDITSIFVRDLSWVDNI